MSALITIVHIIVCLVLIMSILLQSGKSADLAGAFGGMGSQTAFGPRGTASLLSKVTTACAIIFMFTSLGLWMLSAKGTRSVLSGVKAPATTTQTTPAPQKKEPSATVPQATQPPAQKETAPAPEKKAPETQAPAAKPEQKPSTPVKK